MFENRASVFFSVIIPVYNKEKWIKETIWSVLNQTFSSFELIIVDDNSNDNSILEIKSFLDDRIRVIERDRSGPGGYAARNLGVNNAIGEWIVFLDADDLMLSHHLSVFHKNIVSNSNVNVFVNGFLKTGSEKYNLITKEESGVLSREEALRKMTFRDFIIMNNIAVRRSTYINSKGFVEDKYKSGGDVLYWLTLIVSEACIYYDDEVTSLWRVEGSEITKNVSNYLGYEPVLDLDMSLYRKLNRCERKLVEKIFNRKTISRMRFKKQSNKSFALDIKKIKFMSLRGRDILGLASLFLPLYWYKFLLRKITKVRK